MLFEDSHLTDHEILLAADNELPPKRASHLSRCWACRARKEETDDAIRNFVGFHRDVFDPMLRPPAGPRALLRAQLSELAGQSPARAKSFHLPAWSRAVAVMAAVLILTALFGKWSLGLRHSAGSPVRVSMVRVSIPEPSLTPGAAVAASREQLCTAGLSKNRAVPAALRKRVFEEYGIPTAEPQAYEVDYLITPALGGSDDIHNLWPQSYSSATWNARVKDRLEDRLHDMVCSGNLDLATAQHDLASDWIAAYRKYFQTDRP
jgi:hypothetical protein